MAETVLVGTEYFRRTNQRALRNPKGARWMNLRRWASLLGGSRIASNVVSADDSAVKFTEGTYPERVSTVNVARIVMRPVPVKHRDHLNAGRAGVLLRMAILLKANSAA